MPNICVAQAVCIPSTLLSHPGVIQHPLRTDCVRVGVGHVGRWCAGSGTGRPSKIVRDRLLIGNSKQPIDILCKKWRRLSSFSRKGKEFLSCCLGGWVNQSINSEQLITTRPAPLVSQPQGSSRTIPTSIQSNSKRSNIWSLQICITKQLIRSALGVRI